MYKKRFAIGIEWDRDRRVHCSFSGNLEREKTVPWKLGCVQWSCSVKVIPLDLWIGHGEVYVRTIHFLLVPDVIALTYDLWAKLCDFTYLSKSAYILGILKTIHREQEENIRIPIFFILKWETNSFRCIKYMDWHWSSVMWHWEENGPFPERHCKKLPLLTAYIMCLVKWIYGLYYPIWTRVSLSKMNKWL